MGGSGFQDGGVVVDKNAVPADDSTIKEALALIHQAGEVRLLDYTQAGAGGTRPGGLVE